MSSIRPTHLRCEYLVEPTAVGTRTPRLSWELEPTAETIRAARQTAWQVLAASRRELLAAGTGDLWDSGPVASPATTHLEYGGAALLSRQRVWWAVRAWDADGRASDWSAPASFAVGLLDAADWQAQWIGDPTPPTPVRQAHNGYHSEFSDAAERAKWVQVDLGEPRVVDGVRLWPARPFDWPDQTPGFLFPVRYRVEGATEPGFAQPLVLVDQTAEDAPAPAEAVTLACPPHPVRYVRLTATRLRERDPGHYGLALAELEVLSGGTNVALHRPVTAADSIEAGAWSTRHLTDGDTTSHPGAGEEPWPVAMLRKRFELPPGVVRATAYVSALGCYELRLNGRRVGERLLAPEWTDYHRRVQYQAYDVTDLVRPGPNAVAALLGDGWYAGRLGLSSLVHRTRALYGRVPRLLAQLEVETADGQRQVIASDGSWHWSAKGPLRTSDMLDGEVEDVRLAMPDWDQPSFAGADWPAVTAEPLGGAALVAQPNEPIRVIEELHPVALTEPQPGHWVFDLGQNMPGWVRLRLRADAGTAVTLRHAEMLNDDGTVYVTNLRGAPQIDHYTCRGGGEEVFEPRFTYHGFRYVEVTGLPRPPQMTDLVGRVFCSSAPEVGAFRCSDPSLERLWRNILWTQRANLMSTPTDCPQRDERLGWMGDIQAFGQTAVFNMDLAAFFTKWLQDVRDAQADDGRFPDFAPHPFGPNERFSGVPAWGDAGTIVPWTAWVNYGDRRLLAEQYGAACRWVEYIRRQNPDLLWRQGRHNDYNDWLNGDTLIAEGWPQKGGAVPPEVLATAFFAQSTTLVARMARVLGQSADAERYEALAAAIRAAFCRTFVDREGQIRGHTQAGYALALAFDLLPIDQRPAAVAHLVQAVHAYDDHLSTGIQTTHRLMLELSRAGHDGLAYKLLLNRTFPSWLYSLDNGATTIWERWDGYVKGRGFQNPGMNSFNHWALGAVGEWLIRVIGGIQPDEAAPGYQHFTIAPRPGGGLTWAAVAYHSIRGPIRSSWQQEPGRFTLEVTVPPNTHATVTLPARPTDSVLEGGQSLEHALGVTTARSTPAGRVVEVQSGTYRFVVSSGATD